MFIKRFTIQVFRERKIMTLNVDRALLTMFYIITLTSIVLIFFETSWYNQAFKNSNIINDLHLTVASEYIVIENPHSSIITPYFASKSGNRIWTSIFPLKLPRFIKIGDKIINIKTWNLEVPNIILLKDIEVDRKKVVQKANVANLKIHLEEENEEKPLTNLCFKIMLETINTTSPYKAFSGLLKPLTGHLYGSFYIPPEKGARVIVKWEPFDKTISLTVYYLNGEVQNYFLESGEWSGLIRTYKDSLNLIIGNLDENTEISYSIFYMLD